MLSKMLNLIQFLDQFTPGILFLDQFTSGILRGHGHSTKGTQNLILYKFGWHWITESWKPKIKLSYLFRYFFINLGCGFLVFQKPNC